MRSPQSPGSSTYLDHIEGSPGGRFAEAQRREMLAKPQIIGTEPSASYPKLPFNPFQNDNAPEPTIDMSMECGPTFGIGLGTPDEVDAAARVLAQQGAPPPQSHSVVEGTQLQAPGAEVEPPASRSAFDRRGF